MRKINIILIILLSCLSINFYAHANDLDISNNSISSNNLLVQQSAIYIKKHAWLIALTPIMLYFHQDISHIITHRPYISSLTFYLTLNYICDAILHYQEQQFLLKIIMLLKKITLYLVMSHGIKNHIHQKTLSFESYINDQDFLNAITEQLPYSFDEVTLITLKTYQELKACLQSLNMSLHIESEEFVFLCHASSINLYSLLYLVQNDSDLSSKVHQFEQDPQQYLQPLLDYLRTQITTTVTDLEQQLLQSNIHAHTSI